MDPKTDLTRVLFRQRFGWAKVALGFLAFNGVMAAMIAGLLLPVYYMETMPNDRSLIAVLCIVTVMQMLIASHSWRVHLKPTLHDVQVLGIVYMMAASTAMAVGYMMYLVIYSIGASLETIGVPRFHTPTRNIMFFGFELGTLYILSYGVTTWIAAFGCIWTPVEKFNVKSWSIMSDPKLFNAQANAVCRQVVFVLLLFVLIFFLSFGYPPPELHILIVSTLLWFIAIYPLNVRILPSIARCIAARHDAA